MKKFSEFLKQKKYINEGLLPNDKDLLDEIILVAENEGQFYQKKDYKGAIDFAMKGYMKDTIQNLNESFRSIKNKAISELKKSWSE